MLKQNLLAAGLMTPIVAFAATSSDQDIIEQIIVTAQKRETALQDVPFAVGAATEQQIRDSGSTNIVDLARNMAGLTITDLGPGQSQVAIRGVSAGQVVRDLVGGVKESVGVYLDESPISQALFTPDLDLFDLERFEVLRGPQGTLFGAGSSAGTVRYITKQPVLGEFGGAAEANGFTGSDTEFGGGIKGAVNLPMGDKTALRVVGYYDQLAGFIDSVYPGRGTKEDVNGGERYGGRAAMLFQLTDNLSITPRLVYQKLETDGYPRIDYYNILGNSYTTTEPPVTPGDRGQVTQLREGINDEVKLGDLKIELGLGGATLTSITSYMERDVVVTRDASQLTGSVTYGSFGGSSAETRLNSPLIDTTNLEEWSEELRLASGGGGMFDWLIGGFYQHIDRTYGQNLPTPGYDEVLTSRGIPPSSFFGAPPDTPYWSNVPFTFKQWAIFGEGTYHFNDQWGLTAGLRWYNFDEDRTLTFAGVFSEPTIFHEPDGKAKGSTSSDGVSPRVILSFEPNDDVMLTAQFSQGFRLGGINDPLNTNLCTADDLATYSGHPDFGDETVTNYELGAKTQWGGGRVTLNGALFYSDIKDLQVIADAGQCSSRIILNAKAESMGAELELYAHPTSNWDFGVSATYQKAEITKTRTDVNGAVLAGIRDGNRLPTSPEFQASLSAQFNFPFSSTMDGFVNFTGQYVGSSFTQLADQEAPFGQLDSDPNSPPPTFFHFGDPTINGLTFPTELPSYEIGNLRFGLRAGSWEAALYVNNLWDERAFLSLDRERGSSARVGYLTNMPRTYGFNLHLNF
jgi:iron complex outermembrane receptor protein